MVTNACYKCSDQGWLIYQIEQERESLPCPLCGVPASAWLVTADGVCWVPGMPLYWWRKEYDDIVLIEQPELARDYLSLQADPAIEHPYQYEQDVDSLPLCRLYAKHASILESRVLELREQLEQNECDRLAIMEKLSKVQRRP